MKTINGYYNSRRRQVNCIRARNRRGATLILALILMVTLVGMLAFSVDLGYLATSKAEMRRTADAAALAGAWCLLERKIGGDNAFEATAAMKTAAAGIALQNPVCNQGPSLQTTDISEGFLSSLSSDEILSSDSSKPFLAVRVQVQKTEQANGAVPLFFARIFGQNSRETSVSATAALAKQIKGFSPPSSSNPTLNLLPFALDLQTWNSMLSGNGTDSYKYDSVNETVSNGNDGILEVNLYPQGIGSPGNRGTVDIGSNNNSTSDLARQIVSGISASDLAALGKPLSLDANGTMTLNGDTGISAGVKDELASIIGQTRVIPIFSSVTGNGNNANYTIVKWAGVRILNVRLTGSMSSKQLIVQPAPVLLRHCVVGDSNREWSDFLYSPVVLTQ